MSAERREFFRIQDEVALDYRVISEQEAEDVLLRIQDDRPDRFTAAASFAGTSRQLNHILQNLSLKSPDLAMCLSALDKKLNTLAQMLVVEEMDMGASGTREVSLSAGGLAFNADQSLKIGELLETRIVLFPSVTGILTVSRVVNCERRSDVDGDLPWRVAVEYQHVREADQDLLVKHVLNRQAEQRRAQLEGD